MAYGIIPDMKEPNVCETPCNHTDCKANREDFIEHADCVVCGKKLVPGDKFCYVGSGKYDKAHWLCV